MFFKCFLMFLMFIFFLSLQNKINIVLKHLILKKWYTDKTQAMYKNLIVLFIGTEYFYENQGIRVKLPGLNS